ncbi:ABC transporter substrate-binding protein [Marinactinospora rubrisoli]|uniref:ABC transporter substrate-binding protein n=1 Tax=Marinactinospora rubrisoli TaxID=2715399 RepID=A0ABW2KK66_9ACTN
MKRTIERLGAGRPARAARVRAGVGRRELLAGAGSVLLLGAAGCAGGPEDTGEASGTGRRIEHKHGTTEVAGRPSRVVTVGLTEQDYVLALGGTLVGVREWFGGYDGALWPWAREVLGDAAVPEVLPVDELNFEQIAALEPDLVLGVNSGLTQEEYDLLSNIAPTVAQPAGLPDYGAPWQDIARIVGRALDREDEAEALVADIEERFEQVRAEHPEFDGATGLLATFIDEAAFVYAEGPAPGFLTQLGLQLPEAAAELFTGENREPVEISLEQLEVLNSDVLLVGLYGDGERLARRPVVRDLDVAREGRMLTMPEMSDVNGALSFGSVLSLPFALDELVPRLADLIDGDPETEAAAVE